MRNLSERKKLFLAGGLVAFAIFLLGGAVAWRFRSADGVSGDVVPAEDEIVQEAPEAFTFPLVLSTTPGPGELAGRVVETETVLENIPVTPANLEERDAQATGTVTLRNDGSNDQSLIANTRLLSEGDILFRMREAATVPADGSVSVEVYADQPGASGNVPLGRFTIPGLSESDQKIVYGVSSAPMTGGVVQAGVLSLEDVRLSAEASKDKVLEQLDATIAKLRLPGEITRPSLVQVEVLEAIPVPDIGSETASAVLSVRYGIKVLLYDESVFRMLVDEAALSEWLALPDAGVVIRSVETEEVASDLTKATFLVTVEPPM